MIQKNNPAILPDKIKEERETGIEPVARPPN